MSEEQQDASADIDDLYRTCERYMTTSYCENVVQFLSNAKSPDHTGRLRDVSTTWSALLHRNATSICPREAPRPVLSGVFTP